MQISIVQIDYDLLGEFLVLAPAPPRVPTEQQQPERAPLPMPEEESAQPESRPPPEAALEPSPESDSALDSYWEGHIAAALACGTDEGLAGFDERLFDILDDDAE